MAIPKDRLNTINPIIELLGSNGIATDSIKRIISILKPLKLKKGEFFNEIGKRSNKLGILIEGLLIAKYEKNDSGDEVVSRFYYSPRNIIVASFESFYSETKSNETIEALEDSYIAILSHQDLYMLYNEVPEMNTIGRQLAEQSYIQALQRIHQLQAMSPEERFNQFYKDHSKIATKLQVQHLCSYIGVNRNALSRLNKKSRK